MTWSGCGTPGHVRQRLRSALAIMIFRCGCSRRRGWGVRLPWGRRCGVVVSGAPGVGKTALVDELRPVVTGRDGWFVAGKFDQFRRDVEFDAGYQGFRALGRLLAGRT